MKKNFFVFFLIFFSLNSFVENNPNEYFYKEEKVFDGMFYWLDVEFVNNKKYPIKIKYEFDYFNYKDSVVKTDIKIIYLLPSIGDSSFIKRARFHIGNFYHGERKYNFRICWIKKLENFEDKKNDRIF